MKTNNIFKVLAMAMLMPAMLLTTACSSEDDLVNNTANTENTINKGYALPVTVNVTRQGDATTRATYNESTRKLEFSGGDKLFVYGEYDGSSKKFAGTLDYVPATGKFSGTIYTESPYEDTADALFTAANEVTATLLPNGYDANGSNSFLSIDNKNTTEAYDDRLTVSGSKAFVASETAKATGVEQLSFERTYTYSSGFTLSPGNAILNFTISGLEAGAKNVSLKIHHGFDYDVTGSVTPNASGVATFAVGVPDGANIKEGSNNLSVGSHNFTLPGGTALAAGKIYNIARNAIPGALIGQFSVGANKKVYFSKGNLQATYNGSTSTWTWAFAEHQYDYIGNASGNTMVTDSDPFISENATVDLFGWVGASSTWDGVNKFGITSAAGYDYLNKTDGYGNGIDEILKSDWGATMGSGWCTLSKDEWRYLFNSRTTGGTVGSTAQACYTMATINTDATSVNGIILFPDGVDFADTEFATLGAVNSDSDWGTECTTAQWTALAAKGCVFLPAAGSRDEADVDVADDGYYWSSSAKNEEEAYYVYFRSEDLIVEDFTNRYFGFSVRLVRPVQ